MSEKKNRGPVDVFMQRESVNAIMHALNCFIIADPENIWANYAAYLMQKITRYGRTFRYNDTDSAVVYFYEDEAAMLIKLLSLFINVTDDPTNDYYSLIENRTQKKQESMEES